MYHWLFAAETDVFCDHKPLLKIFQSSFSDPVVDRFSIYLSTFQARLFYLKGTKNLFADLLSRNPPLDPPVRDPNTPKFFKTPIRSSDGEHMGHSLTVKHRRSGRWVEGDQVYPANKRNSKKESPWLINSLTIHPNPAEHQLAPIEVEEHQSNMEEEDLQEFPEYFDENQELESTDSEAPIGLKEDHNLAPNEEGKVQHPVNIQKEDQQQELQAITPAIIGDLQRADTTWSPIITALEEGLDSPEYIMLDNRLYHFTTEYKNDSPKIQLCIPKILIETVLQYYHKNFAHPSARRTYMILRHRYFWFDMFAQTCQYVFNCVSCRAAGKSHEKAPLCRSEIPTQCGVSISIDWVGPLSRSHRGNSYILTIADRFSGFLHAVPTPDKSAASAVNYFLQYYLPYFGCPLSISSDNDPAFSAEIFQAIYAKFNIRHLRTSPFHPAANKVERSHKFLAEYFKKNINNNFFAWDDILPQILFTYHSTPTANGLSPFQIHFAREVHIPYDYLFAPNPTYLGECPIEKRLQDTHRMFVRARKTLLQNQDYNLAYQKRQAKTPKFKLHDQVMIKNYSPRKNTK